MDSWNRNPTNQRRVVLSSRREVSDVGGAREKGVGSTGEPLHRSIPPQIGKGETISHRQLRSQSRRPNRLYGIDRCREAKLELIPSDLAQYRQCPLPPHSPNSCALYAFRLLGVPSERSTYPRRTVVLSGARPTSLSLLVGQPTGRSICRKPHVC